MSFWITVFEEFFFYLDTFFMANQIQFCGILFLFTIQ